MNYIHHFAVILCCTALLFSCSSALPKAVDGISREEQGFLKNIINRLANGIKKRDAASKECPHCPKTGTPCIGIALDTTHSMKNELNLIKRILTESLTAQNRTSANQFCYAFVEVRNYNGKNRSIIVATSESPGSLETMIREIENVVIRKGSIEAPTPSPGIELEEWEKKRNWEESFEAIMRLLNKKRPDNDNRYLMENGQILLITDAQTRQKGLNQSIINNATSIGACIHSFISNRNPKYDERFEKPHFDPVGDGLYEEVSDATSGMFVRPENYSYGEILKFLTQYANTKCGEQPKGLEVVQPVNNKGSQYCGSLTVSALSSILRIAITADSDIGTVTITSPNGTNQYQPRKIPLQRISEYVAFFTKANPKQGEWMICSSNGDFEITTGVDLTIQLTPDFLQKKVCDNEFLENLPQGQACSLGQLEFCTTMSQQSKNLDEQIHTASLLIKTTNVTVPLDICNRALTSHQFVFPPGHHTFDIVGEDSNGDPFRLDAGSFTFPSDHPDIFEVTMKSPDNFTVVVGEEFQVVYNLTKIANYCTSATIDLMQQKGFDLVVSTSRRIDLTSVSPGESVEIILRGNATNTEEKFLSKYHTFSPLLIHNPCDNASLPLTILVDPEPITCPPQCDLECDDGYKCGFVRQCVKEVPTEPCTKYCLPGQTCVILADSHEEACAIDHEYDFF